MLSPEEATAFTLVDKCGNSQVCRDVTLNYAGPMS
jgi:hypothetical protein